MSLPTALTGKQERFRVLYTRQAQKDAKRIAQAGLKERTQSLLDLLAVDPFQSPPRYEKLLGNLAGAYSRRITIQHRLDEIHNLGTQSHVDVIGTVRLFEAIRILGMTK